MNLTKQQKEKLSSLIESFVEETAEIIIKEQVPETEHYQALYHWVSKAKSVIWQAKELDGSTDDQYKQQGALIKQLEKSLYKRIIKNNKLSNFWCGCLFVLSPILLLVIYILVTEGF